MASAPPGLAPPTTVLHDGTLVHGKCVGTVGSLGIFIGEGTAAGKRLVTLVNTTSYKTTPPLCTNSLATVLLPTADTAVSLSHKRRARALQFAQKNKLLDNHTVPVSVVKGAKWLSRTLPVAWGGEEGRELIVFEGKFSVTVDEEGGWRVARGGDVEGRKAVQRVLDAFWEAEDGKGRDERRPPRTQQQQQQQQQRQEKAASGQQSGRGGRSSRKGSAGTKEKAKDASSAKEATSPAPVDGDGFVQVSSRRDGGRGKRGGGRKK